MVSIYNNNYNIKVHYYIINVSKHILDSERNYE